LRIREAFAFIMNGGDIKGDQQQQCVGNKGVIETAQGSFVLTMGLDYGQQFRDEANGMIKTLCPWEFC